MKTVIFIISLALFGTLHVMAKEGISLEQEVKEYDQIFSKIANKRVGADVKSINDISNPFVIQSSEQSSNDLNIPVQEPEYSLEAIVDRKVKINGKWYWLNETIESFKITKITQKSVIIANEIEQKELFIKTNDRSNIEIFSK